MGEGADIYIMAGEKIRSQDLVNILPKNKAVTVEEIG